MIGLLVFLLVIIGTPVFAVMGGWTELAWLTHQNPEMRVLRFLAPDVLDERFAGSPVLVTIPLFTFIGYMMAESKTPQRIVRAAQAFLGWVPGGLAIVCIMASAFFTTFTGGSAITIVAIGALLYPTMVASGYPERFALGVVTTSGSVGLLLPPSLPILVYSLVAGIDFNKAFKSGIAPGMLVIAMLSAYAAYVAIKKGIPRQKFDAKEAGAALWEVKWEIGVPFLILAGLGTGLTQIDEAAALAGFYAIIIEVYVYKDLDFKDFLRIARNSMGLAGGLLLIMTFAMSLTNYMISEQIPDKIYEWMSNAGINQRWEFLFALNLFLYVMVMDGISMILVSVPLITPFAARFGIQPFHMCIMFLLNMEVCNLTPPFGQNVFVASYRFNRSMVDLYKLTFPFLVIMAAGLIVVDAIPRISTFAVENDIREAKAKAAKFNEPPREAWLMECVQEDRNNPLPCTKEDKEKWGSGNNIGQTTPEPAGSGSAAPGETPGGDEDLDDMLKGAFDDKPAGSAAPADSAGGPTGKLDDQPAKEDPAAAEPATEDTAAAQVTAKHVVAARHLAVRKQVHAVARKN
ncbi:MAG TPA: TRAP transporter large permease [Polyangiaceae bacterium]|jgi:tripartite ATP-independent transporter DctM subunit|nr:TRAP transporter large permease [Polyangiaceae bacterium]